MLSILFNNNFFAHSCIIVFLPIFVFSWSSSVFFLVTIISLPPHRCISSSIRCIDESTQSSMLASPFIRLFLTHSHEFSCSLINLFKFFSGPLQEWSRISYEGTVQVFIPLIRFVWNSFVLSSFLVLLRYSFLICSFISTCFMVSASNVPQYLYVSFSPSVLIFSWFGCSISSAVCRFPLFITCIAHFSMSHSILCPDCILSQPVLEFPILFVFGKQFMSSMYIRWLILRFCKFVATCLFPENVTEWHHHFYKY